MFSTFSEKQLIEFAKTLSGFLQPGMVIELKGPLGAGKTTFVRGVLRGLGYKGTVKSPTFTLVEEYRLRAFTVYHVDLYRLSSPEEVAFIGLSDYFHKKSVVFIEWPEKGTGFLPKGDVHALFKIESDDRRILEWKANTPKGERFLNMFLPS